jgi:ComF family protein
MKEYNLIKGGVSVVKRSIRERLIALLFPERCCCCGKPVSCGGIVCERCRPALKRIMPPVCTSCGLEVKACSCGRHKRHMERCVSPFYYEGAAKSALHRLKFNGKEYAAEMFSLAMEQTVKREYGGTVFDCVVPVPLSDSVHRKRKYNQSTLLAKRLAGQLGIPYQELLVKQCETTPQRELPAIRRSGNVLGVFDAMPSIHKLQTETGFTALLVDDTVTTGATLDECAKILKLYGACCVYAVTATASRLSDD